MPSKSAKQHRFMAKACHDPEFAKKRGISRSTACEFLKKDREKYRKKRKTNG